MECNNDVFSILVASDIHLGFAEKDPIRGDDSFTTFEEILQIAEQRQVDLIILGGDLFHDNKPSAQCIHRCLTLLRRYCMGDRPVTVEFLSDQAENFQHCVNPVVNYEDPNFNISIPVYSIHGNHDDPSGYGRVATLDILSASGLINYFGKWTDLNQIEINPILLQKGSSRIAMYGLSYIKDERLSRLFRDRKVTMLRPKEYEEDWFNIFVLHQNRVMRGPNNYLPEESLDDFLDLIIWGHEHECIKDPEKNIKKGFFVVQPGSPVATSLCEGEAAEKYITIFFVKGREFKAEKIKLKTVRPFVIDTLSLSKCLINRSGGILNEEVQLYLTEIIENLIQRAKDHITGHKMQPRLPLIRLRVEYSNEMEYFNPIRFGQQFADKVANPTEMILLKRERKERQFKPEEKFDRDIMQIVLQNDDAATGDDWASRAEAVVEKYFAEDGNSQKMRVLSIQGMAEAVKRFIDKSDTDSVGDITKHQIKKTIKYIHDKKIVADEDSICDELENFRLERLRKTDEDAKDAEMILNDKRRTGVNAKECENADFTVSPSSDSDECVPQPPKMKGERGCRGGRGRATPRTRSTRGGRGSRAAARHVNLSVAQSSSSTKN